jgi:hypothetical protein
VLRNVLIENVTTKSAGRVSAITAFPGAVIEGVRLRDCVFRGVEAPDVIKDSGAPSLQNVTIERARKEKK